MSYLPSTRAQWHSRAMKNKKLEDQLWVGGVLLAIAAVVYWDVSPPRKDWATCVLDKMPNTQSDITALSVMQVCNAEHGSRASVVRGGGRGWFGYSSGAECAVAKGGNTPSNNAARAIRIACNLRYDAPTVFDPFDGQAAQ